MLRLLRGTVVKCPMMPMTGMLRTRWCALALLATSVVVVLLALGPPAHATDPPTPGVSDRRSALPPTGFTRAAVAPPSAQGPSIPTADPNQRVDTPGLAPNTVICGNIYDFRTGIYEPYRTSRPVLLRDGAVIEQAVDLHVPGPISDGGKAHKDTFGGSVGSGLVVSAELVDEYYHATLPLGGIDNAVGGRIRVTHLVTVELGWSWDWSLAFTKGPVQVGGAWSEAITIGPHSVVRDYPFGFECRCNGPHYPLPFESPPFSGDF